MSNFIPLPSEKILMLDLDGTVIDGDYRPTEASFDVSVSEMKDAGWAIGLSSDTPYEVLQGWSSEFGFNGPIIAEKGAVIDDEPYSEADAELFEKSKNLMDDLFKDEGFVVWNGNPVDFIRKNQKIGIAGDKVVLMNEFRKGSLSFFVRGVDEQGRLVTDDTLLKEAIDLASKLYPEIDGLEEDCNPNYGILIISKKGINKRFGTRKLMASLNIAGIGMIGDSYADFLGNDIARHYAVGNADIAFKDVADYVASSDVTAGVTEIFNKILLSEHSV